MMRSRNVWFPPWLDPDYTSATCRIYLFTCGRSTSEYINIKFQLFTSTVTQTNKKHAYIMEEAKEMPWKM